MSVLIRDMEMPKNCAECPVNLYVCKRGYEYLLEHTELYDQRADDCPISYVPPHGRLIDADALEEYTDDRYSLGEIGRRERDDIVNSLRYCAPTIIPAEETQPSANNVYDQCEVHENCTVEVWSNSETGETSVGWWPNE